MWHYPDYPHLGNSLIVSKLSGEGIKLNTDLPAFGYRDILGVVENPATGAGKPAWTQIAASGVYNWSFAINDIQTYMYHMPHDYAPGTDIYFHTHWFGSQTAQGWTKWQYDFLYAKGHQQSAFATTTTTVTSEQQQEATAYTHMISETTATTISGMEPDGVVLLVIKRIAATSGTDVSGAVYVPCVDIHYQSTNIATKNKAYPFYG